MPAGQLQAQYDHGRQHRVKNRRMGSVIKVVYCCTRREDVSPEKFHDYWLNEHGPKVKARQQALRMVKYVQSHTTAPDLNDALQASRGLEPSYDGITEVWFGTLVAMEQHPRYGVHRPYMVVNRLSDLVGPRRGVVELPLRMDWSQQRRYDLDRDGERRLCSTRRSSTKLCIPRTCRACSTGSSWWTYGHRCGCPVVSETCGRTVFRS
jgi:hypothetical protein